MTRTGIEDVAYQGDFDKCGKDEFFFVVRGGSEDEAGTSRYSGGDTPTIARIEDGSLQIVVKWECYCCTLVKDVDHVQDIDGDGSVEIWFTDFSAGASSFSNDLLIIEFQAQEPKLIAVSSFYDGNTEYSVDTGLEGTPRDYNSDGRLDFVLRTAIGYVDPSAPCHANAVSFPEIVDWNGEKAIRVSQRFKHLYDQEYVPEWKKQMAQTPGRTVAHVEYEHYQQMNWGR